MERLETILIVALLAAFIVLLVKKWGWAEWMQIHGDDFSAKLFGCDLCMSFWACMLVSIGAVLFTGNNEAIFIPLVATPVTRILL